MDFKGFIYANRLKQKDVANYLEITEASVSRMASGLGKPSNANLIKLLNNPYGWDTSLLVEVPEEPTKQESVNPSCDMIPVIPTSAQAGSLSDYADAVMPYHCEMMTSPVAGATCAIRVVGDSMTPKYPSGSLVFLRKVSSFLEYGRCYVLDTTDGAVLKEIEDNVDQDVITCVSINEKYRPFNVPKECIKGYYKVIGTLILE